MASKKGYSGSFVTKVVFDRYPTLAKAGLAGRCSGQVVTQGHAVRVNDL